MNETEREIYNKGFVAGYRAGMQDAKNGYSIDLEKENAGDIPIQATKLSTRAKNRLRFYGCKYLRDVTRFDYDSIRTMRNLGGKTASEIALYLDSLGICYSAWNAFL